MALFEKSEEITLHNIISHFSISRATAGRWVQDLIREGKIKRVGKTRSVRFRPASE